MWNGDGTTGIGEAGEFALILPQAITHNVLPSATMRNFVKKICR